MRYHIITYGCQMNKSDSERIASVLENIGYKSASSENEADLIVVNMCSVRQSAVDRVYGLIQKFKNSRLRQGSGGQAKPKTVLTGCILPTDKKKFKKGFDLILNIKDLPNLPEILDSKCSTLNTKDYLQIQPKYRNDFSVFIPISNGCNNLCTYCVVPFTRGRLKCRPHKEIIKEVKNALKNGFKEIWLLGQNVNDYHSPTDSSINFVKLLKMINRIPGDFKILFISPHPKNFSDELIETLVKCEKFGKYLNLPVQSGDDQILKKMNRNYTVKEYKNLIKKMREKIPGIKLSTDVIVGFPGETKKHFQNTVKLFKELKFDWAYISKYSPRPGTAAFKTEDNVSLIEKKKREKTLIKILKNKSKYG